MGHPPAMPTSSTATYTTASNQLASSSLASGITYDAAGNVTYDGTNAYLYDAEGRICASENGSGVMTGYIYDGAGIRVAKASLTSFSCAFATNGYKITSSYVLGPGGEQVTEYAVSGTTSTWVHTNAFAGGRLLASYHDSDTYFALEDWLGTKRMEITPDGLTATYRSLPYGNGLVASGTAVDATEQHFTGKERDAETGDDYFEARYYSSNLGRFMSPDWSAKEEPIPYAKLNDPQSLNLYAYVRNAPTVGSDVDGHDCGGNFQCQSNQNWIADHQIANSTDAQLRVAGLFRLPQMQLSSAGRQFLEFHEAFGGKPNLTVYPDSKNRPTIGFGHLIKKGEDFSQGIKPEEADKLFAKDLQPFVRDVNHMMRGNLFLQYEFDALVSVDFNSMRAAHSLVNQIFQGKDVGTLEFVQSLVHGFHDDSGLVRRRMDEAELYRTGIYSGVPHKW